MSYSNNARKGIAGWIGREALDSSAKGAPMSKTITEDSSIPGLVASRRDTIMAGWLKTVTAASRGRISESETSYELTPIFNTFVKTIENGGLSGDNAAQSELRAMLAEYARVRARQGFTPSETAVAVFALRDAVLTQVESAAHVEYSEVRRFSKLIDDLGLVTFETHVVTREAVISSQTEQLLELSTPVIKLWEGVLGVPLVGTLDSARTQVVMESLLQMLVDTGSSHAIIDITGVPAVDTQVAQHLLRTVFAARLMGAQCVISGIRPQIAQTVAALGVEFGDIATKATLADALRLVLSRAGFEVRKTSVAL
jgi:rsbT co-antagonist protein RsbR